MKLFHVDAQAPATPLAHDWEMCVGSCHGTTALREDYRQQLLQCHRELGFRYVRFHGLFDDDMSVLTRPGMVMSREDAAGEYVVSFTNVDSIFDFLLSIGMKPFVELGFMPECLKSGETTIFHYKAFTTPPKDHGKWTWFIETFAAHLVERYGLDEVRQWYFEVWNEPNLGGPGAQMGFWGGSMEDYFALYKASADGLKKVDSRLKVGGPATADNAWVPELIDFCESNAVPLDFITTHHYPTDVVLGYRTGIMNFMDDTMKEDGDSFLKKMLEMRENMWTKIPRGTLTEMTKEVVAQAKGLPVIYTEWNSGAGILSDGPFGSSFIAKTILDGVGLTAGYSYWTFSDLFEEGGMPHVPFHGGFGLLNLNGIPKAPYRAFELLHKLGDAMLPALPSQGTVDVYAVRKTASNALQLMLVNHQSLMHDIEDEQVIVRVEGLGDVASATVERVDETHGNALKVWMDMGSPDYLRADRVHTLTGASHVEREAIAVTGEGATKDITLTVPAQGMALVTLFLA